MATRFAVFNTSSGILKSYGYSNLTFNPVTETRVETYQKFEKDYQYTWNGSSFTKGCEIIPDDMTLYEMTLCGRKIKPNDLHKKIKLEAADNAQWKRLKKAYKEGVNQNIKDAEWADVLDMYNDYYDDDLITEADYNLIATILTGLTS